MCSRETCTDEKQGALEKVMSIAALYMYKIFKIRATPQSREKLGGVETGEIHDQNILNGNILNKNKLYIYVSVCVYI